MLIVRDKQEVMRQALMLEHKVVKMDCNETHLYFLNDKGLLKRWNKSTQKVEECLL